MRVQNEGAARARAAVPRPRSSLMPAQQFHARAAASRPRRSFTPAQTYRSDFTPSAL